MDEELLELLRRIASDIARIADYLESRAIIVPFDDLEGEWNATAEY